MVLYRITLVALAEELRAADPGLLSLFYANNAAFDGSARQSTQLLKLLMERGPPGQVTLHIGHTGARGCGEEGLELNFRSGSQYLGAYPGPQEELVAWVKPQMEAWDHRVRVLGKISQQHPQSDYSVLGMSLQLKWQYLQRNVPGFGTLLGPLEEALREKLSPLYLRGGYQHHLPANPRP